MRKSLFFLLFVIGIPLKGISIGVQPFDFLFTNSDTFISQQEKKLTAVKTVYICPMHSEIALDKSGKCPKCGMNLKPKEAKTEVYTCPMHPEIIKDKQGKCPKCGMDLALGESGKNLDNNKK